MATRPASLSASSRKRTRGWWTRPSATSRRRCRVRDDVDALDGGRARVGAGQGGEDLDGGGLAGAVRADEGEDSAAGDSEREAVKRADAGFPGPGIGLNEAAGLDGCRGAVTAGVVVAGVAARGERGPCIRYQSHQLRKSTSDTQDTRATHDHEGLWCYEGF